MNRDAFLGRIRQAAAAGRTHRTPPKFQVPPDAGYAGAGADLPGRLAEELKRAGAFPCFVQGAASAVERVCDLARDRGARRALRWSHPVLDRMGLEEALADHGVEVVPWSRVVGEGGAWDLVFDADLGISGVDLAVAETGTLALASWPGQGRSVSLLPPVHIALVEPRQVVPDLFDLFGALRRSGGEMPGNVSLITGPSKTGDIELRLTTGVHGPGEVHVIILERDISSP